ncbi:MAG: TonB-dependent receptor [Flavobacteriales bacterium]|jgi:iron complex outermembrane recepter protein|nr:TonB-dependent receptor [Flavobacteriales bacterium]
MFNKKFNLALIICLPFICISQKNDTIPLLQTLPELQITGVNAGEKTPVSYTNISESEIEKVNLGQDLPYLISLTPSVVSSSDAGAGIGYTYMTIRGSDASRINVTVNGIPLNDAESQGVWWVNMPDFSSSVSNIQIQRGVGTSTNGGSAFGGSVNLNTNGLKSKKYVTLNNSVGSYNSLKNNIEFGTGLLNGKWAFDGRLSRITSDGYIDRASSDLKSSYFSGGYYGETQSLKAIVFTGHERTYQAWNGVPQSFLDSLPTFNPYNYEDEVDDYRQTHYQLHYNKQFNTNTFLNFATHYTKGAGYYEQYKGDKYNSLLNYGSEENLADYALNDAIINGDTITTTNLIRRKWLDNDFYGITFSANHSTKKMNFILGGAANTYVGDHFGNVIWSELYSEMDHEYYRNKATKNDQNIYLKTDYSITEKLNLFADLQTRSIQYNFEGLNDDGTTAEQSVNLNFFNPKLGAFYSLNNNNAFYASYSVSNKEPNRNDYVESSPSSRPKHETVYDTEVGWKFNTKSMSLGINLYHMDYNNQLINTGEINDVGYSVHSNIKESYRKGIEVVYGVKITKNLNWNANLTLSDNKIVEHTEYIDNWDTGGKLEVHYENTDISFSPNIIAKSEINYKIKNLNTSWVFKHIGKQYIDNSESTDRMLDAYSVSGLLFSYSLKFKNIKDAKISLQVNNLLNNSYSNRAWVYRFISEGWNPVGSDPYTNADTDGYNMIGYFPQATRNYMLGITLGL